MASKRKQSAKASESSEGMDLFGPAPLMEGEDGAAYDRILAQISAAVHPKNVFEEIWVREIVDLSWEVLRWRRLKVAFLAGSMYEGVKAVLTPLYGMYVVDQLQVDARCRGYVTHQPEARKQVEEMLASANLGHDAVHALTLAAKLTQIEQIDRLIASAEARRNATLREIARYRRDVADQLRDAATEIEARSIDVPRAALPKKQNAA